MQLEMIHRIGQMCGALIRPAADSPQRLRTHRKVVLPPLAVSNDQTCLLENPYMLGDGRQAHRKRPGDRAQRQPAVAEAGDDAAPNRIGQRPKRPIEFCLTVNDSVNYSPQIGPSYS